MAYLVNVSILVDSSNCNEVYDSINALMHTAEAEGESPVVDYQISDAQAVHTELEDIISNDTYEEGDAFRGWLIFSQSESDASGGEAGYWSNDLGWCSLEDATVFDYRAVTLPMSSVGNDAAMISVAQKR